MTLSLYNVTKSRKRKLLIPAGVYVMERDRIIQALVLLVVIVSIGLFIKSQVNEMNRATKSLADHVWSE